MLPAHAGLVRLFEAAAEGSRMDPRRQCDCFKQESLLAPVHRSLHLVADEQVIMPDVTENPIYGTDDVVGGPGCCRRRGA